MLQGAALSRHIQTLYLQRIRNGEAVTDAHPVRVHEVTRKCKLGLSISCGLLAAAAAVANLVVLVKTLLTLLPIAPHDRRCNVVPCSTMPNFIWHNHCINNLLIVKRFETNALNVDAACFHCELTETQHIKRMKLMIWLASELLPAGTTVMRALC